MTRYTKDQFFNITKTGESGTKQDGFFTPSGLTQAPFKYPGNTVRFTGFKNTDANFRNDPTSWPLQKGYMRSLLPSQTYGPSGPVDIPSAVCQFQFNPATIRQNVQQNPNVTHFIMQEPSQYSQPMMGNVNFQFDLLFDRSAELNTRSRVSRGRLDTNSPWDKNGPEDVGVLHDLSRLFSVIGQGMSQDQLEFAYTSLSQQYINDPRTEVTTVGEGEDATEETSSIALDESRFRNFLNENLGNAGFLLPLPVRVLFSSLYIVEGLVQSCEVQFTRFTTQMVPMQCFVSIVMEAKYIGFSKSRTFFTYSLGELEETQQRTWEVRQGNARDIGPTILKELERLELSLANNSGVIPDFDELLDVVAAPGSERSIVAAFPDIETSADDPLGLWSRFVDGQDLLVSLDTATIQFFYYDPTVIAKFVEETGKSREENPDEFVAWLSKNARPPGSAVSVYGNTIVSTGFVDPVGRGSTADSNDDLSFLKNMRGSTQKLSDSSDYRPENPTTKYYCLVYEFQATVKYDGQEYVGKSGDRSYLLSKTIGYWNSSTEFLGTRLSNSGSMPKLNPIFKVEWPTPLYP